MSSTTTPPIPRQPIGTTFIVSVCVLGAVAIIQLIAAIIPVVRYQIKRQETQAAVAPVASVAPPVAPVLPSNPSAPPAPGQLTHVQKQKATAAFEEAKYSLRIGDYDNALKKLDEVAAIAPGDLNELLVRAQVLERSGQPALAAQAIQQAMENPELPDSARRQLEMKLDLLAQSPGFAQEMSRLQTIPQTGDSPSEAIREDGVQIGATLGISEAKLRDTREGVKTLRVAIKSRAGEQVQDPVKNVKLRVTFFEKTEDGEILETDSKPLNQWISAPMDWAENLPEICDVLYTLPNSESSTPGRTFYGYTVGVYYRDALQDTRADPGSLDQKYPLPFYLPKE